MPVCARGLNGLLYHLRHPTDPPNFEGVCVGHPDNGWNPERDSGALGTGAYATITEPAVTRLGLLLVYPVDATRFYKVRTLKQLLILATSSLQAHPHPPRDPINRYGPPHNQPEHSSSRH